MSQRQVFELEMVILWFCDCFSSKEVISHQTSWPNNKQTLFCWKTKQFRCFHTDKIRNQIHYKNFYAPVE